MTDPNKCYQFTRSQITQLAERYARRDQQKLTDFDRAGTHALKSLATAPQAIQQWRDGHDFGDKPGLLYDLEGLAWTVDIGTQNISSAFTPFRTVEEHYALLAEVFTVVDDDADPPLTVAG